MTNKEIVQALRCSATKEEQESCEMCQRSKRGCFECINSYLYEAASLIEQMTAESVVLPDGQASAIESMRKEIEWKDMVISLAQREQAKALDAADLIDRLTAENAVLREKQRWIPVTERMPELEVPVLVLDRRGNMIVRTLRRLVSDKEAVFRPDGLAPRKNITHWMPLPEAPEEGKK